LAVITEGDVLPTAPLDLPRRALPDRVRVEQERDHHLRIERRAAPTVAAIGSVERVQIDLLDRVDHKPGQVILRQPVAQTRRQQQLLVTVASEKVEGHRSLLPAEEQVT
jgi:hypothetical protein